MALGLAIALGSGCVHNAFTPATARKLPPRPEDCYLDLVFHGEPPAPYVVLGSLTTESDAPGLFALGEGNEAALTRLREEACRVGAHGLLQAHAQSQGVWTRDAYSKSTSGSAVAFIYVDPAGAPLPPPRGPRLMIQPGAAPPPPPAEVTGRAPSPGSAAHPSAATSPAPPSPPARPAP